MVIENRRLQTRQNIVPRMTTALSALKQFEILKYTKSRLTT
jgi:hypothetical protein